MERDLAKLRALAEAATPGPWLIVAPYTREVRHPAYGPLGGTGEICEPHHKHDAAFIAAANPSAVLALLDEIDMLRGMLDDAGLSAHQDEDADCDVCGGVGGEVPHTCVVCRGTGVRHAR